MSQVLVPFTDVEKMASAVAKSGLFGVKTPEQALALMLIAQAEGLHPAVAARDYHVIQGRPALKSDAMLARFQAAGGKVNWNVLTDKEVSGTFSHPSGGSATISWTFEQAKNAGLTSKDNWKQYPRAMLRARVISEGIRTVYPGVSVGVYTPEEISDFDSKPEAKEIKVEVQSAPKQESQKSHKEEYLKILQSGKWTIDQLKKYAQENYSVESSKDLSEEQLEEFSGIVQEFSFEQMQNSGL